VVSRTLPGVVTDPAFDDPVVPPVRVLWRPFVPTTTMRTIASVPTGMAGCTSDVALLDFGDQSRPGVADMTEVELLFAPKPVIEMESAFACAAVDTSACCSHGFEESPP
jgi:hypothetical protein